MAQFITKFESCNQSGPGTGSDQFWQLLIFFCSRSPRVALCDHKVIKPISAIKLIRDGVIIKVATEITIG